MTLLAYSLLIGLSSYRFWRIFALDKITEPVRTWMMDHEEDARDTWRASAWTFAIDLFSCPWCAPFWYSCLGAWLVSDAEGYGPVQFALLALAGSAIAGATHKAVDQ